MKKKLPNGTTLAWLRQHVEFDGGKCLIWPFAKPDGRGTTRFNGRNERAHRVMCKLAHGESPIDKPEAAHSCGNRSCVNPRHLRWANRSENELDKIIHGTSNRGSRHGMSKLTTSEVIAIRAAKGPQHAIAASYGVSRELVGLIRRGERWAWL